MHTEVVSFLHKEMQFNDALKIQICSTLIDNFNKGERQQIVEFLQRSFNINLQLEEETKWNNIRTLCDLYCTTLTALNVISKNEQKKTLGEQISVIIPNHLYLSGLDGVSNLSSLKGLNIRYIINCAAEIKNLYPENFIYTNLVLRDAENEDIAQHFVETFAIIEKAKEEKCGVLLQCRAGISRSATITIAYLMKFSYESLKDTVLFVQKKRPIIQPNRGYMKQLIEYEKTLFQNQESLTLEQFQSMVRKH